MFTVRIEFQKVYDVKCSSCHKLTDEKLVGPGWKGVTQRHEPVWIMNFATNPDVMPEKDPSARASLRCVWFACLIKTFLMRRPEMYWNLCDRMME